MSLGADIAWALPQLRAEAESRMTETIRAGRFTLTTDPVTGDPVRTLIEERYVGIAEIKDTSMVVSERVAASQLVLTQNPVGKLPVAAAILLEGDEIEVTASTADAALVDRVYRVAGLPQAGNVTAHRYPLEANS